MSECSQRKPLGKKLRFRVFERDQFTCQYCGKQPPDVVLHCDHIIPVSQGGTNDPENLRTSCDVCNLGKGADALGDPEVNGMDSLRRAQEAAEAKRIAKDFAEAQAAREELRRHVIEYLCNTFSKDSVERRNVSGFIHSIHEFGVNLTMDWFDLAARRTGWDEVDTMKYFYGILRKIREENDSIISNGGND